MNTTNEILIPNFEQFKSSTDGTFVNMVRENMAVLRGIRSDLPAMYLGLLADETLSNATFQPSGGDINNDVKKTAFTNATSILQQVGYKSVSLDDIIGMPVPSESGLNGIQEIVDRVDTTASFRDIVFSDDPEALIARMDADDAQMARGLLSHKTIEEFRRLFNGEVEGAVVIDDTAFMLRDIELPNAIVPVDTGNPELVVAAKLSNARSPK